MRVVLVAVSVVVALVFATPAMAHHQDKGIDSDGDTIQNFDDSCPYVAGACDGAQDLDGDLYRKFQDPCDDNAANEQCDADGDGQPDQYDPCPSVASGHNLGSDQPLERQERSCPAEKPSTTDQALVTAVGDPAPAPRTLDVDAVRLVPGQTPQSIVRKGLRLDVRCNKTCSLRTGVAFSRGRGYARTVRRRAGRKRTRITVRLPRRTRRQLARRRAVRGDVSLQAYRLGRKPSADRAVQTGVSNLSDPLNAALRIETPGGVGARASRLKVTLSRPVRARASATYVLQDRGQWLNPSQQRSTAIWWNNAAYELKPTCAFNVIGIPKTNANIGWLAGILSGQPACDQAKAYSRIAHKLFPEPNVYWKYYRIYTAYIQRRWAYDVCDWWIYAKDGWINFNYRPRGGRCY